MIPIVGVLCIGVVMRSITVVMVTLGEGARAQHNRYNRHNRRDQHHPPDPQSRYNRHCGGSVPSLRVV